MVENTLVVIILVAILSLNFYTLNLGLQDLGVSDELSQNSTDRLFRLNDISSEVGHGFRTNYAWEFNTRMQLNEMQEDIDEIKRELGINNNLSTIIP